jgi:hypothetical protein
MSTASFKVGDRVRVRTTRSVQAGTRGVVHSPSYMVPSAYFVLFDDWLEAKLIQADDLEYISDERTPLS